LKFYIKRPGTILPFIKSGKF